MNSFLNSAEFIQCKYGDETVCIIRMNILDDSSDSFRGGWSVQGQNCDVILEYVFMKHSCMKIVPILL